jgi:signal transduction histidine kinase/ligand-binding sensor domain-containing protein/DNA-binding response OmpR family regulator
MMVCTTLHVAAQSIRFFPASETLSNSLISTIYQDSIGYVWIGTNDGLNRYDGNKVAIYRHEQGNARSLIFNKVLCINNDVQGRLLVGTQKMGLQQYNYDTDDFTSIPMNSGGNTGIEQIYNAPDGRTFIVTVRSGIKILTWNGDRPVVTNYDVLPHTVRAHRIAADNTGRLWILTSDQKLLCSSGGRKGVSVKVEGDYPNEKFTQLFIDNRGVLYAGTESHGLYMYDSVTHLMRHVSTGITTYVSDIEQADGSHLYVATDGDGIKLMDVVTGLGVPCFTNLSVSDMSHDKVASICRNRQGGLWVGSYRKGFYFCPRITYDFGRLIPSFSSRLVDGNYVTAMTADTRGGVWVAVSGNGLYHFDENGTQLQYFAYKEEGSFSFPIDILSLKLATDGKLWVGSFLGEVGWVDTSTGRFTRLSTVVSTSPEYLAHVRAIDEAPDHSLWFCTVGYGLVHYNPATRQITQFASDPGKTFGFDYAQCLTVDQQGRVYFGYGTGAGCYDPRTDSFTSVLGKTHIFSDISINSILTDQQGHVWAGSDEGLLFYDPRTRRERHYTMSDGLPSNGVMAIELDRRGHLWVSTLMGLAEIDVRRNKAACYYTTDGLQSNEFSQGVSAVSPDGRMYFGGSNGVNYFSPDNIMLPHCHLVVVPSEITLGNTPVTTLTRSDGHQIIDRAVTDIDHIRLSYRDASFSIGFTTFTYVGTMAVTYTYSIDGGKWMSIRRGDNHVSFTHLAPGTYKLRVKARVGNDTSAERLITIVITPPWYASWWAFVLYILLVAGLIYTILRRYRERQQEKLSEMRLRFFTDISHDIRTPMTLIISPLEQLMNNATFSKEVHSTLQLMYANANRILELINQLLTIRRVDNDKMRLQCSEIEMVGYLGTVYQRFAEQARMRHIDFTFTHQMDELLVWADTSYLDKITDNLLGNAIKYTPEGGSVELRLSLGTDSHHEGALAHYMQVDVIDTGTGLDEKELPHLFERFYRSKTSLAAGGTGIGLNLCEMLISKHHGKIGAENRKDGTQGSRFFFRLPLGRSYLLTEEIAPLDEEGYSADDTKLPAAGTTPKSTAAEEKNVGKTSQKLLIIDDDPDILDYLSTELGKRYTVVTATNGNEGLQAALSRLPDLVISDVMMPDMDGYEFVRRLKHNPNINDIPVILLTAKGETEDRVRGLDRGADAYMVKPFHLDELNIRIRNLIENRLRMKGKYSGQQSQEERIENVEMANTDEQFMERVMQAVNRHLDDCDYKTEELAQDVGVSRVHLHRKLKALTGVSPGEFVRNLRLKQAARLLLEQQGDITQVAYACGFSSSSVFSTAFKKCYGVSPRTYIEQNGTPQEPHGQQ